MDNYNLESDGNISHKDFYIISWLRPPVTSFRDISKEDFGITRWNAASEIWQQTTFCISLSELQQYCLLYQRCLLFATNINRN